MSEIRRKAQQERSERPSRKNALTYGVIALLVAGAYFAGWWHKNHQYDAFAKCLAAKQAKMYGLFWCPHCAEQKEMLGASFRYVPYVECAVDHTDITAECKAAGAKLFPSWQFGAEPPKEGVLSLEALSEKTGCSLP